VLEGVNGLVELLVWWKQWSESPNLCERALCVNYWVYTESLTEFLYPWSCRYLKAVDLLPCAHDVFL
jgi:hypothetical protein